MLFEKKGDLAAGLKNTRSIDVDTPELIRKKESRPSKEANISGSPTGVFPGQEEVVSAPSVLRAPYSGKSWQQLAADRLPYCVRLLDVAKVRLRFFLWLFCFPKNKFEQGRGETPATKQRESDGNWRPLSWSGLALLVERVAKVSFFFFFCFLELFVKTKLVSFGVRCSSWRACFAPGRFLSRVGSSLSRDTAHWSSSRDCVFVCFFGGLFCQRKR
jgi:hypothetical protein